MSAVIPFVTPFEAARLRLERHQENFYEKLQASNYSYAPEAEWERLERALLDTPARTRFDAAYKVQRSRECLDDITSDDADIRLLDSVIKAIQAGDLPEAIKTLHVVLSGETDYPFAYEGAAAALADLHRLNHGPKNN
ncbi:MAG TPA: hypothetical protein DIC59_05075 [Candidatus Competibacteraceae bacterium]|nr:hypothetical protein [Candidatus Competibacteraceae bacterium]